MHCSIQLAVHRQICPLIWIFRRQLFVDVHTNPGRISGMHRSIFERIRMREHLIGFRRVRHVFLNAEVMDAEIEVQRRTHAHGT